MATRFFYPVFQLRSPEDQHPRVLPLQHHLGHRNAVPLEHPGADHLRFLQFLRRSIAFKPLQNKPISELSRLRGAEFLKFRLGSGSLRFHQRHDGLFSGKIIHPGFRSINQHPHHHRQRQGNRQHRRLENQRTQSHLRRLREVQEREFFGNLNAPDLLVPLHVCRNLRRQLRIALRSTHRLGNLGFVSSPRSVHPQTPVLGKHPTRCKLLAGASQRLSKSAPAQPERFRRLFQTALKALKQRKQTPARLRQKSHPPRQPRGIAGFSPVCRMPLQSV